MSTSTTDRTREALEERVVRQAAEIVELRKMLRAILAMIESGPELG